MVVFVADTALETEEEWLGPEGKASNLSELSLDLGFLDGAADLVLLEGAILISENYPLY